MYTEAIETNPFVAAYDGNRSFAYLKMECFGAALSDATKALELDKSYVKVMKFPGIGKLLALQLPCSFVYTRTARGHEQSAFEPIVMDGSELSNLNNQFLLSPVDTIEKRGCR